MHFERIADIFAENDAVRADLKRLLAKISDDQAALILEGEKWTIAEIVEHISIVDEGASKICSKLLGKPDGQRSQRVDAKPAVSEKFSMHLAEMNEVKLDAPERVQPTGAVSISDSMMRLDGNRKRLRELQPSFESAQNEATFPHPYFGEMSAVEWLILIGRHESRHLTQIRKVLEKLK